MPPAAAHAGGAVSYLVSSAYDQRWENCFSTKLDRAVAPGGVLSLGHISMDSMSPRRGTHPAPTAFRQAILLQRVREFFSGITALPLFGIVPALVQGVELKEKGVVK
jgi:hypothetical protein